MAIQAVWDVLLEADQAKDQWLDPPTFLDTSMGVGLDDLHRSLPTQTSLGFHSGMEQFLRGEFQALSQPGAG